jgi:hypothetical protein
MIESQRTPFVVIQKVWIQVSADYAAAENTRTLVVTPETTVSEIMRWAANCSVLGRGDVILTEQDNFAATPTGNKDGK